MPTCIRSVFVLLLLSACVNNHPREQAGLALTLALATNTLTQGVVKVPCELKNVGPGEVMLRDWFIEDRPPNVSIWLEASPGNYRVCTNAYVYNSGPASNIVLRAGERIRTTGKIILSAPPGDYRLFALLDRDPNVTTSKKKIRIVKGEIPAIQPP